MLKLTKIPDLEIPVELPEDFKGGKTTDRIIKFLWRSDNNIKGSETADKRRQLTEQFTKNQISQIDFQYGNLKLLCPDEIHEKILDQLDEDQVSSMTTYIIDQVADHKKKHTYQKQAR